MSKGIFEEADGGTVYFDEIGNMPLEIQAKLLRVLQEKEILRMGSSRPIPLNFRVICAHEPRPEEMAKLGRFKGDLLQRLSVVPIHIPPLRERQEDIPLLLNHFSEIHETSGRRLSLSSDALAALVQYPWPGNVRELNNLVALLSVMADSEEISIHDLPAKVSNHGLHTEDSESFYKRLGRLERDLLHSEYTRYGKVISKMASGLQMDRSHLYSKLKEHGLYTVRE